MTIEKNTCIHDKHIENFSKLKLILFKKYTMLIILDYKKTEEIMKLPLLKSSIPT